MKEKLRITSPAVEMDIINQQYTLGQLIRSTCCFGLICDQRLLPKLTGDTGSVQESADVTPLCNPFHYPDICAFSVHTLWWC